MTRQSPECVGWGDEPVSQGEFVLPMGTVTLLLADIEGSTRLWETAADAMGGAVARFDELVDVAVSAHDGVRPVEQGEGDSFVAAFSRATSAAACALEIQRALADGSWPFRVRMALHTDEVQRRDDGNYVGAAVNRCARVRALAHGGQTIVSRATHDLVVDRLPDGAWLTDLGTHRLRDLTRPEGVFQLCHPDLAVDFPPLRSLDTLPNNLPVQLSRFIGREAELRQVDVLMRDTRLLTLTGSGGSGKTRLALQGAADAADRYPGGVWFVDLAPLTDGEGVARAVVAGVGGREEPGRDPQDTAIDRLRGDTALIVLDNCEHVIDACATLGAELLRACPDLSVLATSRQPLAVDGETTWRVPSLSLPQTGGDAGIQPLTTCDAVALFVDRACRARPNFTVTNDNAPAVAAICRRLEGIPLAIELAAARVRVLTLDQIAGGLDDRFRVFGAGARTAVPRHQTLMASVAWSHDLLTDSERVLLRRLAVFAGDFSLDAAEWVGGVDPLQPQLVLGVISDLVEKSLVNMDDDAASGRYRMLETMRQYARDRLVEAGEETPTRLRHLEYYTDRAERTEAEIFGPAQIAVLDSLRRDFDNFREAFDWGARQDQAELVARLAAGLSWFLDSCGRYVETHRMLCVAKDMSDKAEPWLRARVLSFYGAQGFQVGDPAALGALEEGMEAAREAGDPATLSRSLFAIGWIHLFVDPPRSRELLEEAHTAATSPGGESWVARMAKSFHAGAHIAAGDLCAGRDIALEVLAVSEQAGDVQNRRYGTGFLAWANTLLGAPAALDCCREHVELSRRVGDEAHEALGLLNGTGVLAARGEVAQAQQLFDQAAGIAEESGPFVETFQLATEGGLRAASGDRAAAKKAYEQCVLKTRPMDAAYLFSWDALASLAEILIDEGDLPAARELVDEGLALADRGRYPLLRARTLIASGVLLRGEGDVSRAEAALHEALAMAVTMGARPLVARALDELAALAALHESWAEATRLYAAAQMVMDYMGHVRWPSQIDAYKAEVALVRDALGGEAFDAAWAEGAALSMEEAAAYAARGRGERKRPSSGWASLTPTELDVVRLAAEGLTNAELAARLFISPHTVKVHLAHIFTKLGISKRAELAAAATRRGVASA